MRLLLVTQDYPPVPGGIQTYTGEVAIRLASRVDELTVVAPHHPDAEEIDRARGVHTVRLRVRPDLLPFAPGLVRELARHPGAVAYHAQWQTLAPSLWLRGRGRLRGVVSAALGRELLLPGPPGLRIPFAAVRRAMLRRVDHVAAISTYTADLVRGLGVDPQRCTIVPNGVTPRPASAPVALPDGLADGPLLLTVARLVARKGVDDVLDAVAQLVPERPSLRYVVVGDGPERARLEAHAAALGLGGHVRFVGTQSDAALASWYAAADVFVMAPRTQPPDVEGFGLVYLEAGAAGLPVVGTRSGGVPDAIADGETGLLVPEGDPAALAEALRTLLDRPDLRERFGAAGRASAARFTWDATADRLLAIFSSL